MHKAFVVSSFTLDDKGGNLAGVVFGDLDSNMMQHIASQLGFSETVFVNGNRFRYFTPVSEIDFCGHATLAALYLIDNLEMKIQTNNFTIQAFKDPNPRFSSDNGLVVQKQIDETLVQKSLGITADDVDSLGMSIVYAGLNDLFIHVKSLDCLKPDFDLISRVSKELDVVGYHVFMDHPKYDASTRNFAPLYGINEESATGSANAGLAYLLSLHNEKKEFTFLQGEAMNKSSKITILMDDSMYISGEAKLIETRIVEDKENVKTK